MSQQAADRRAADILRELKRKTGILYLQHCIAEYLPYPPGRLYHDPANERLVIDLAERWFAYWRVHGGTAVTEDDQAVCRQMVAEAGLPLTEPD